MITDGAPTADDSTRESNASDVALEARGATIGYGALAVVDSLDLVVRRGRIVALFGANGAGKTTTLMGLAGELPLSAGTVLFDGESAHGLLHRRARRGLGLVTEDRSLFMGLTAADNLRAGGVPAARVVELFPELEQFLGTKVGLLSGGQQQMLSVARALARDPKVLLIDELSLGLAPMVVDRLLLALRAAADRGTAVLLVEQHVRKALRAADDVYVLRRGKTVFAGPASDVRDDAVQQMYF
jgi:branched-chain amino acid transport system ATP-binding protein